jgi:hypothetical protein
MILEDKYSNSLHDSKHDLYYIILIIILCIIISYYSFNKLSLLTI